MSLIFLILLVGISVSSSVPFWPSASHDGRGSNCAHVPLPSGPPVVVWEGPTLGPNTALPLTPLVDENGSIIILSDSDSVPKAVMWSATGVIQVFPSFCYGNDPILYGNGLKNFVILPGGCVVAPCMTASNTPGEPGVSFSLIAVPGATENPEACAGIVPWTTQTLEPYDVPFQANLETPVVDDSGQYIMSVDASAEEACSNDEECEYYLTLLALRIGDAQETKIPLAACDFIPSGQPCLGSGSYTNGVISGGIGNRVFFSIDNGNVNSVALDKGGGTTYFGNWECFSRLAASTEGTVYCVTGLSGSLVGWFQSGSAAGPPIPLIPGPQRVLAFLAVGLGPSALIIVAFGNLLLGATLQLEQVWNVTLPGTAGALIIDENSIIVSTTWGLVSYRVSDGFLLWTSAGLATDATNLVSAAPYTLVAVSPQRIYYLVATSPTTSSLSPTETVTTTESRTSTQSPSRTLTNITTSTTSSPTSTTSGTTTPSQTGSDSMSVTSSTTATQTSSQTLIGSSTVTASPTPTVSPTISGTPTTSNSISPKSLASSLPTWTIITITFSTLAAGIIIATFTVKVNAVITKSERNHDNPFLKHPLMVN
jgi:hypothetical protein